MLFRMWKSEWIKEMPGCINSPLDISSHCLYWHFQCHKDLFLYLIFKKSFLDLDPTWAIAPFSSFPSQKNWSNKLLLVAAYIFSPLIFSVHSNWFFDPNHSPETALVKLPMKFQLKNEMYSLSTYLTSGTFNKIEIKSSLWCFWNISQKLVYPNSLRLFFYFLYWIPFLCPISKMLKYSKVWPWAFLFIYFWSHGFKYHLYGNDGQSLSSSALT